MKIASIAEVKARFSACVRETSEGPVIVTRNGKPVAVLLAVRDDDEVERIILAHSRQLRDILETSRQQIQSGKGIPHDEFWGEIEKTKPHRKKSRRKSV